MLTLLILVLLAGLEHDTVMDQKTPHDSAVLHLLSQVPSRLTLECVNLRGVVLPVTTTKRFALGQSETLTTGFQGFCRHRQQAKDLRQCVFEQSQENAYGGVSIDGGRYGCQKCLQSEGV